MYLCISVSSQSQSQSQATACNRNTFEHSTLMKNWQIKVLLRRRLRMHIHRYSRSFRVHTCPQMRWKSQIPITNFIIISLILIHIEVDSSALRIYVKRIVTAFCSNSPDRLSLSAFMVYDVRINRAWHQDLDCVWDALRLTDHSD